ncbi:uncharacterized protein BDW43DRAFT_102325 [Aspergillus alliaceus]|uniref:uncharacterized protein n=1 Tax=Petromyces alliaceus TaxID=209559 RepID=UPI0012A5C4CE|nr:uncharacterized protein BDW43DRAFT_102325 [Aspergillus alliaceus]KAB8232729.1 hypothetical protein BDW43DRAFT_102325 [Aspergillus alliaceus]
MSESHSQNGRGGRLIRLRVALVLCLQNCMVLGAVVLDGSRVSQLSGKAAHSMRSSGSSRSIYTLCDDAFGGRVTCYRPAGEGSELGFSASGRERHN